MEQTQPLSFNVLVNLERLLEIFANPNVLSVLRELDATLHQPLDRFSDGRLEVEKRMALERWMALEHAAFPPYTLFGDLQVNGMVMDLLTEAAVFARMSPEGKKDWFKSMMDDLVRNCETVFGVMRGDLEARIAAASRELESSSRASSQYFGRGGASESGSSVSNVSNTSRGFAKLTHEQQQLLRDGKLRMERTNIGFIGDVWDRPVSSQESWIALWLLFRFSLLVGLAERRPGATKTFFNLRPLGSKVVLWSVLVIVVAVFLFSKMGSVSFDFLLVENEE